MVDRMTGLGFKDRAHYSNSQLVGFSKYFTLESPHPRNYIDYRALSTVCRHIVIHSVPGLISIETTYKMRETKCCKSFG